MTSQNHALFRLRSWFCALLILAVCGIPAAQAEADDAPARDALWRQIEKFVQPPAEFAGQFGEYRSPLKFADGSVAKSPEDWARRRKEIVETWHRRLGPWPPLVERPTVKRLESLERDGFTQHHVHVQVAPEGKVADGYLLVPKGKGPFPAVLVPFYEPLTSIGQGPKGKGTHDYGLQLVQRGFVTLSIGTPGSVEKIGLDTRQLLVEAGVEQRRQPLTLLAYVAANCHTALAQMPEVDAARIGIVGLSYGGKWSMFASCLHDKFACAVWSDPGIVFNEKNSNVNYWEPWYLGYDPKAQRKPGVPSAENPRTGLYKELVDAREDLIELHALMAPRPVLVSGGTEDPPRNWQALNHLVSVNEMLGHRQRVAMTARPSHVPTADALAMELAFLEYWLKPGETKPDSGQAAPAAATGPFVRIASGVAGHIHPAACVTKSGAVLVIFSQSDMKDLRVTRSTDGGRSWSQPAAFGPTEKLAIYPGSLTTLADGRVIHAWNVWYPDADAKGGKSRFAQFSISSDEGLTWSETRSLPKPATPEPHSVLRHPLVELNRDAWLFTLMDRTVAYDPQTDTSRPFGDGRNHGLVPIVRTIKGTLVSGAGLRSTDQGTTWQPVSPFPKISADGWRYDLMAVDNGWLVASEVLGPGIGGDLWRFVVSRDDGQHWDFDGAIEFYNPGRPIGGRACPKTVQLDRATLGTVFYDTDANQPGGPGVFFLRTPLKLLELAVQTNQD